MENSDKIRETMYLLAGLDAVCFADVRTQIDCARRLLRDVAIACSVQEMSPDNWQVIEAEHSKIRRVKKVRRLLGTGLIEAKRLVELHFDQNGSGALIEDGWLKKRGG